MKFLKRIKLPIILTFILAIGVMVFSGCSVNSSESPYLEKPDNGYYMQNLNVTIDASKGDRSMKVTQKFTLVFKDYSHGFYIDLPLNSGEKYRDVKILDSADFNNSSGVSHEERLLRIRIGDPNIAIATDKELTAAVSYTMITPKLSKGEDVLAVNAIGNGWTCKIKSANVKVILPAAANENEREFYYGAYGETKNAIADEKITVNTSSDSKEFNIVLNSELKNYNGLTVYLGMPKGTFKTFVESEFWVSLISSVLLVVIVLLLFQFFGRDVPLTPITNFYPPVSKNGQRMSPATMGYLIDGVCSPGDISSLIFFWASQGYLQISNIEEDKEEIVLTKLKNMNSRPDYEKKMFDRIFSNGHEVNTSSLNDKIYVEVNNAMVGVKAENKTELYDKKSFVFSVIAFALILSNVVINVALGYLRISTTYFNFWGLIAIIPILISSALGAYIVYNWLKLDKKRAPLLIVFFILVAVSALSIFVVISNDAVGIIEKIILSASTAAACLITPFIAKRTKEYTATLNDIIGFRNFIQTCEKDKLEMLLKDNPEYYYDVLPYANVLGVSDIWEDKFKNIALNPPAYYSSGDTLFSLMMFNSFYRHAYRGFVSTAISRPSSSSGSGGHFGGFGGGGGGGFSGGGFGGGGGGRF